MDIATSETLPIPVSVGSEEVSITMLVDGVIVTIFIVVPILDGLVRL